MTKNFGGIDGNSGKAVNEIDSTKVVAKYSERSVPRSDLLSHAHDEHRRHMTHFHRFPALPGAGRCAKREARDDPWPLTISGRLIYSQLCFLLADVLVVWDFSL